MEREKQGVARELSMVKQGMNTCPSCQSTNRQVKNGQTASGNQRSWCRECGRTYVTEPRALGYLPEMRAQAVRMYVDEGNLRRIARTLGVVHQTVANWIMAQADALPDRPPQPAPGVHTAELDDLFTFVVHKKT